MEMITLLVLTLSLLAVTIGGEEKRLEKQSWEQHTKISN
jgi:hypothetical protein